jgi:hypothetical protein
MYVTHLTNTEMKNIKAKTLFTTPWSKTAHLKVENFDQNNSLGYLP